MSGPSENKPPVALQHVHQGILYDFVFPKEVLERANDFQFDSGDCLVVGYPKSGTTWLQEIAWLVQNKADREAAGKAPIMQRVPLLELQIPGKGPMLDTLANREAPRMMNTHLQGALLQKAIDKGQPKVIVIIRNPKDTLVSYYHFYNTRQGFDKIPTFSDFFEMFKDKKLVFGDWLDHVTSWYPNEGKDNFMFIKYEDMKADHYGSVEKIAKFLNKDLSPEQLASIVDHTSLSSMKKNKQAKMGEDAKKVVDESKSAFVRKGIVGDWKNHFSNEQSDFVNDLCKEKLTKYGIEFPF